MFILRLFMKAVSIQYEKTYIQYMWECGGRIHDTCMYINN